MVNFIIENVDFLAMLPFYYIINVLCVQRVFFYLDMILPPEITHRSTK